MQKRKARAGTQTAAPRRPTTQANLPKNCGSRKRSPTEPATACPTGYGICPTPPSRPARSAPASPTPTCRMTGCLARADTDDTDHDALDRVIAVVCDGLRARPASTFPGYRITARVRAVGDTGAWRAHQGMAPRIVVIGSGSLARSLCYSLATEVRAPADVLILARNGAKAAAVAFVSATRHA